MGEWLEYWPGTIILISLMFGPLVLIKKAHRSSKTALLVIASTCLVFLALFVLGAALQSPPGYWPGGFLIAAGQIIALFAVALTLWLVFVVRRNISND